ncbi:MAG: hypothetical protein COT84_06080 [Chlamydiae bacterium CG10_big_fil_rev_8_21_14_0_10_35_9]|nr:MAG: hypothetical protein COT84_06080 [Chlamydiae bacterium CG10_big_fil_rev_8_21_14_0_10_35_9]
MSFQIISNSLTHRIFRGMYPVNYTNFPHETFTAFKIGVVANERLLFLVKALTFTRLFAAVKIKGEYHIFINSCSLFQYFHTKRAMQMFKAAPISGIYYPLASFTK